MNATIDITPIIEAVIALAATVITVFLIPWIKSKITETQWNNLTKWADTLVQAYENIIHGTTGLGAERREKVMEELQKFCNQHGYKFEEKDLRAALESAVKVMHDNENKTSN